MYHLLVVEDESLIRRGIRAFIDFDNLGIGGIYSKRKMGKKLLKS